MKQKSLSNDLTAPQPILSHLEEYRAWMELKGSASATIRSYTYALKAIPDDVEVYFSNKQLKGKRIKIAAYRSYLNFLCKKKRILDRGELSYLEESLDYPKRRGNNTML